MKPGSPLYIYISGRGKPRRLDPPGLPLVLARNGSPVLAIDVRGTGETSPTPPIVLDPFPFSEQYPPDAQLHNLVRHVHEVAAMQSLAFGRTLTGMRTLDVLAGIRLIKSREDLQGRRILLVGEGFGGVLALLAGTFDPDVDGVATIGTIPAYKLFVTSRYYHVWDYFWVPGVLKDFDIPDLACLLSPRPQLWIDPLNATGDCLDHATAISLLDPPDHCVISVSGGDRAATDQARLIKQYLKQPRDAEPE